MFNNSNVIDKTYPYQCVLDIYTARQGQSWLGSNVRERVWFVRNLDDNDIEINFYKFYFMHAELYTEFMLRFG